MTFLAAFVLVRPVTGQCLNPGGTTGHLPSLLRVRFYYFASFFGGVNFAFPLSLHAESTTAVIGHMLGNVLDASWV